MKKIGKVLEYDEYIGVIIDEDSNKYIFKNDDVLNEIKIGDLVEFTPEVFETIEIKELMARFIKKTGEKNV